MGEAKAKITLTNVIDQGMAQRGFLKEPEVRRVEVEAVVDTGATTMVIPETLRARLGLEIEDTSAVMLAGGKREPCTVAGPVHIRWNDRYAISNPIVLAGETDEVLLGVYPLEEMDVMVDVVTQRLVGAHGDNWARYARRNPTA